MYKEKTIKVLTLNYVRCIIKTIKGKERSYFIREKTIKVLTIKAKQDIIKTIKEKEIIKMKYVGNHNDGMLLMQGLVNLGGELKMTKIIFNGFNEMEGHNYTVRIKATAPDGKVWQENRRKSMLFEFETNSTWLGDWDDGEDDDMEENEIIEEMVVQSVDRGEA